MTRWRFSSMKTSIKNTEVKHITKNEIKGYISGSKTINACNEGNYIHRMQEDPRIKIIVSLPREVFISAIVSTGSTTAGTKKVERSVIPHLAGSQYPERFSFQQ